MSHASLLEKEVPWLYFRVSPIVKYLPDTRESLRKGYKDDCAKDPWAEVWNEYLSLRTAILSGSRSEWIPTLQEPLLNDLGIFSETDASVSCSAVDCMRVFGAMFPILAFLSLQTDTAALTRTALDADVKETFQLSAALPEEHKLRLSVAADMLPLISSPLALSVCNLRSYRKVKYLHLVPVVEKLREAPTQERVAVFCRLAAHVSRSSGGQGGLRKLRRAEEERRAQLLVSVLDLIYSTSFLSVPSEFRDLVTFPPVNCEEIAVCLGTGIPRHYEIPHPSERGFFYVAYMAFAAQNKEAAKEVIERSSPAFLSGILVRSLTPALWQACLELAFEWDMKGVIHGVESIEKLKLFLGLLSEEELELFSDAATESTPKNPYILPSAYLGLLARYNVDLMRLGTSDAFRGWWAEGKYEALEQLGIFARELLTDQQKQSDLFRSFYPPLIRHEWIW